MEPTLKTRLLHSIANVYEASRDCKLKPEIFTELDSDLLCISDYFSVSKIQGFLIANIFTINFERNTTDIGNLIEHLSCNPVKLLELSDEIEALSEKKIIQKIKSGHRSIPIAGEQLKINEKILKAILKSEAMPELISDTFNDFFEMLETIYKLSEQKDDGEISTRYLLKQFSSIMYTNKHFPLIEKLYQLQLNIWDMYMFLYITHKSISFEKNIDVKRMCESIFDDASKSIKYSQSIISEENRLMKTGLIELIENTFFDDAEITLTDLSGTMLKECGISLPTKKKNRTDILQPSDIPYRKLIFNQNEYKELNLFKSLLSEPSFTSTRDRLKSIQMHLGITALLHGSPGTGKTESALQTARETGRPIMKVDISHTKSLWFGESEKIIKRVFTEYKDFMKESEITPILLFNEADAIFSKRRDISSSNTAQTENAVQNILLDELERFDGILIATTNMIKNLDAAFDRRFLFKIRFEKPDIQSKTEIWKLKLPELSDSECRRLANTFDFSGGQIDNIIRKYQIERIIHPGNSSFDNIFEFCTNEHVGKEKKVIGFK